MATWKKVIVSGSDADVSNVRNSAIAANDVVIGGGFTADQSGTTLSAGQVLLGNASAVPTGTTVSGDATLANDGALSIANDKVTSLMLSGSTFDTPVAGQTVKVGANGAFTFDDASTLLSAGKGITITNNKISSSIYNDNGQANSYGTAGGSGTTFTGSFSGPVVGNVTGNLTGNVTGNADSSTLASTVTVVAEDSDAENFIAFTNTATGDLALKTQASIKINAVSAAITASAFNGSLDGNAASATSATNATNTTNVITANDASDTEAFITFGNAAAATQQLKTVATIKADLSKGHITATGMTGSVSGNVTGNVIGNVTGNVTGDLTGNASSATTAAGLGSNATGTNLVLSGDLTVQGTTTEVQTNNLNIKDAMILLSSGSQGSNKKDSGFVFAGNNIGISTDSPGVNSGSALFVDSATQRLSVTTDGVHVGGTTTANLSVGSHIPLMTLGSGVDQAGNFKIDGGELYVYFA